MGKQGRDDQHGLARSWVARGITRRAMLRQVAGVAFASPILATALAACGGDDDDAAESLVTEPAEGTPAATSEDSNEVAATSEEPSPDSSSSQGGTAWYVDDHPGPPQPGSMINFLLYEDPDSLNPIIGQTGMAVQVSLSILEPLAQTLPDGSWDPVLAQELPDIENGGVSDDLLTVSWKLKDGILWHDGEPLTSEDVKFTWQAASSVEGGSAVSSKFELIESIETPDDLTVVVKYSEVNAGYLDQFDWILPKHATGDIADMLNWDFNRQPIGTGPFKFAEWMPADHVTVVKNEEYREPDKPYIDGINFLVVPSEESRIARMLQGDAHLMLWPGPEARKHFTDSELSQPRFGPAIWTMGLRFNLSKPFDDDAGVEPPHPILGDKDDRRVREAISLAINRDRINKEIVGESNAIETDSPLSVGWIMAEVEPFAYDPEKAKQLLEEAGWVDVDGDGIREAQGAPFAEDGTKMELMINGYTGYAPIELGELAVQEDLAAIGIKTSITNQDFAIIFGTWQDASPRLIGDFDILYYDAGYYVEPHSEILQEFHPSMVPSAENPSGQNIYRWVREDVGEWIDAAGATIDRDERRANYQKLADAIREDIPYFPLYHLVEADVWSTRIHGFAVNTWEETTWDAENWWIEQ